VTRRLALAGLAGPPVFALVLVALTAVEWDFLHGLDWSAGPFDDPAAPWPSVLALGDAGFVQVAAFVVLGVSTLAVATAVWRATRRRTGPALLAVAGLALMAMAFRIDYGSAHGGGPETWNGTVHAAAFTVAIPAVIAAMIALARQFPGDTRLRAYSWSSAAVAIAGLATALAGAGNLFLYLFFAVVLAWLATVAARTAGRLGYVSRGRGEGHRRKESSARPDS
jgi:uncharacterized protein DUF998